ncbi:MULTISPECIES: hypothetical protein [Actinomycetes]|uniref:hypothetical protein n=1 Tax=Actinomycetes TaxID=1760 RepID=UPI0001B56B99|nr:MULTISPECIES: hypothetical protein [Actinomycetes]EFL10821.1 hypothetical protein SSMG_06492 [Streptomyces sp. AA4]
MADNQQSDLPPNRRRGAASIETTAVAPPPGDGYSYDKATLKEIATRYEKLADKFRLDKDRAGVIARTQPPGLDFSSTDNAAVFRSSGEVLWGSLEQCERYCRDQAAKHRAALQKYSDADEAHSTEMHRAGGSL